MQTFFFLVLFGIFSKSQKGASDKKWYAVLCHYAIRLNCCAAFTPRILHFSAFYNIKVDVGIMGHLSSSVNFLGCDYWKKARFMVLHNKDMEILKIKLFQ